MKNYITDFKRFALTESSQDYSDQMELHRMGIPIQGFRVLIVRVDWESIGQKRFDGTVGPFMKCWFMEAYPNPNADGEDSWVEYPPSELVRMVREEDPGDVEFVDRFIMDLAVKNDVDLIWELGDKTWREVPTGKSVPRLDLLR
jgi:hypothetical protein